MRASADRDAALVKARSAFAKLSAEYGDADGLTVYAARELTRILELRGDAEVAAAIHARFPLP